MQMAELGVGTNALAVAIVVATKDIGTRFAGALKLLSTVLTLASEERVLQDSKTMSVVVTGGSSLLMVLVLMVTVVLLVLTCVPTALGGKVAVLV